jgi:lysophospholipase L1-like esterase
MRTCVWAWLLIVAASVSAWADEPFAWVGEPWSSDLAAASLEDVACRVLTPAGWLDDSHAQVALPDGRVTLVPAVEGVHVLTVAGVERRFLAVTPPPPLDPEAVRRTLPRQAQRLLSGEPVTLLAMGDSVTSTGDYPRLLAMLLSRATGNRQITLQVQAHPGRSVDATVRTLDRQVLPLRPQIAVLMYGLNDQGAGTALHVYLEQTRWIATRLAQECGTDLVLAEPTPHIADPASAFRVIGFAQALRDLGAQMHLPVAPAFDALWGEGGASVDDAMARMRPLYPPHYSKRWQTLLELGDKGGGDTIHPNVLGHLAIARALLDTIGGRVSSPPLRYQGRHRWTGAGLVTLVQVTNGGSHRYRGALTFYSTADFTSPLRREVTCDLAPGASQELEVAWPAVREPRDLASIPAYAAGQTLRPMLAVLEQGESGSHVTALEPQSEVAAAFVASRLVTSASTFDVPMTHGLVHRVSLPTDAQVGDAVLEHPVEGGVVVGRLWFVRMARARSGEAQVDGDLAEWQQDSWNILGDPSQASWTRGHEDRRQSPQECLVHWSIRAGEKGLWLALRVQGAVARDRFVIYFDPRASDQLGSVGPYFWCDGGFDKQGRLTLRAGETSPAIKTLACAWRGDESGGGMELFVPYEVMSQSTWPAGGDLGLSISWQHQGPGGITRLQWSERGHPWNTLGYGVARRHDGDDRLPRVIFVRP